MRYACLAVALMGCNGPDFQFEQQGFTDEWDQVPTDQVDILWVIDNSRSMLAEQDTISTGFAEFATSLEESGTQFHLGVITTDFDYGNPARGGLLGDPRVLSSDMENYASVFANRVRVGVDGAGMEKGLEAASHALSAPMLSGYNMGFLRPDANLLLVFVSDEDDCSDAGALLGQDNKACYLERDKLTPVTEFATTFRELKPFPEMVKVAALVAPEDTSGCGAENEAIYGKRYIETARYLSGLVVDICDPEWGNIMNELGIKAAGIDTVFPLSHGAQEGTLEVEIDGELVPEDPVEGFSYDPEAYAITFHGSWVPERGAHIVARYLIIAGT